MTQLQKLNPKNFEDLQHSSSFRIFHDQNHFRWPKNVPAFSKQFEKHPKFSKTFQNM